MSISSCPRCARQISIPAGVSESTKVRCPLCNEQYMLSDALAHVPPMLLIVEETAAEISDEWLAPQSETPAAPHTMFAGAEPAAARDAEEDISFDEELAFRDDSAPAAEITHADMSMLDAADEPRGEESGFAASEPVVREVPEDLEPLDVSNAHDDTVFEIEDRSPGTGESSEPLAAASTEGEIELDFGEFETIEEPEAGNDATLEFQEFNPSGEAADDAPVFEMEAADPATREPAEEAEIEFGEFEAIEEPDDAVAATVEFDPANPPPVDQDIELDFGNPEDDAPSSGLAATVELEHRIPASNAVDAEEIELDFGEPIVSEGEPEAAEELADEAQGTSDKKAKKKKPPREAGEGRPRRTLVSVILGAVVALPLTLYGMTWLGKDYDFFKLGPMLASLHIPVRAEYGKAKAVAAVPPTQALLPTTPPPQVPAPSGTAAAEPVVPAEGTAVQPDATPAEPAPQPPVEQPPVAAAPATEKPAATEPSDAAPPSPPPAEEKPALAADEPTKSPLEQPAATDTERKPSDEPMPVTAAKPADTPAIADTPPIEPPEMPDEPRESKSAKLPVVADDAPILDDQPPAPPSENKPSVADAPQFTLADLAKAMQEAGAASQKLAAVQAGKDEAALKSARTQFYLKMFALAEAVTFTQDDSADHLGGEKQAIEQIMLQFAGDKKRLDALKYNAGRWLDFSKRTTPGIVMAGTVQSCEPAGDLYEVKLGIGVSADEPVVTTLHRSNPNLVQGDQALLLGAIVDNPADKISGYEGLEPMAIWSGMTMKLPAAK